MEKPQNPDEIFYTTTEPHIFSKHPYNREINTSTESRKELKESIRKLGILQPLRVDRFHRIIDGQHRVMLCKELLEEENLKIKIPYLMSFASDEEILEEMKAINVSSKTWSGNDFVKFYAESNPTYAKLYDISLEHNFIVTTLVGLLTGKFNNATTRNSDFKQGKLIVNEDAWSVLIDYLNFLKEFSTRKLTTEETYALFKFWTLAAVDTKRLITVSSKILESWKTVPPTRYELETVIFECYNFKLSKAKLLNTYCIPNTFSGNKRSYILKVRGKKAFSRYPKLPMYDYYVDDEDD